ncbi:hypothetical protein P846_05301, partial [Klebsiella pneumoniae UCI 43]
LAWETLALDDALDVLNHGSLAAAN